MNALKYVLLLFLTVISVYPTAEKSFNWDFVKNLCAIKPFKRAYFWIVIVLSVATAVVSYCDDRSADKRDQRLQGQNGQLTNQLGIVQNNLSAALVQVTNANERLRETQVALQIANNSIAEQSRSIASLVFNVDTSDEGKRRFVRCLNDISRISGRRSEPISYEGLICDDGVAVFAFDPNAGQLKYFVFFSDADVNHVLSGLPLQDRFMGEDGNVRVGADSELALISRFFDAKLPEWSDNALERDKAWVRVADQMIQVFRYAYRATSVDVGWAPAQRPDAPLRLEFRFSYVANPYAQTPCAFPVAFDITLDELKTFFGLTARAFSEKLISQCSRCGIEPKVRREDIRALSKGIQDRERSRTFPYQAHRPETSMAAYSIINSLASPLEPLSSIGSANIAAYAMTNIVECGLYAVTLNMEGFGMFQTLVDVLKFSPPENVLGDDLLLVVDGKWWRYKFDSYDGSRYVLTTTDAQLPSGVGLDSIPFCEKIWIDHKSTNEVTVTNAGQINSSKAQSQLPHSERKVFNIKIQLVTDNGEKDRVLFAK